MHTARVEKQAHPASAYREARLQAELSAKDDDDATTETIPVDHQKNMQRESTVNTNIKGDSIWR